MRFELFLCFLWICFPLYSYCFASDSIDWYQCDNKTPPIQSNTNSITEECADVYVPLLYNYESSSKISLRLQRLYYGIYNPELDSLFLITGGPGEADEELAPLAKNLIVNSNNLLVVYLLDHRGTGFSSSLHCYNSSTWESCFESLVHQYGSIDYYKAFSVTNAALDLYYVVDWIKLSNPATGKYYIYAVSYGTYLLSRYLSIVADANNKFDPHQVDGIILDGVCDSIQTNFAEYDLRSDEVGFEILSRCDQSLECASQFQLITNSTNSVMDSMMQLREQIEFNSLNPLCSTTIGLTSVRLLATIFNTFIFNYNRVLVPPLIGRLLRCNEQDQAVLRVLFQNHSWPIADHILYPNEEQGSGNSILLTGQIALSELFNYSNIMGVGNQSFSVIMEKLEEEALLSSFGKGLTVSTYSMFPIWQSYQASTPIDQYYHEYPSGSYPPILFINGDLDAATPLMWAQNMFKQLQTAHKRFILIPNSGHGTSIQSVLNPPNVNVTCAQLIIISFIQFNGDLNLIDDSCLSKLLGNDWMAESDLIQSAAMQFFGTNRIWG